MNATPSSARRAPFLHRASLVRLAAGLLFFSLTSNLAAAAADGGLLQSAGGDDPKAEVALGDKYNNGQDGLPKDPRKALEYYKRAADAGYAVGQLREGFLYSTGAPGVPQDTAKAAALYRAAADQGNSDAMNDLALLYEDGQGVPKDIAKAVALFQASADRGDDEAMTSLGYLYEHGVGVPKDMGKAIALFRAAVQRRNAMAMTDLGYCYDQGVGLPEDATRAAALYRTSADLGNTMAMFNLSLLYKSGRGVPKDPGQALAWLRKAAGLGLAGAATSLGEMYQLGTGGVPRSGETAAFWYLKAAEEGDAWGEFDIGLCYGQGTCERQDYPQEYTWVRKAAEQNLPRAECTLAGLYLYGWGVAADRQEAQSWFERAGGANGCVGVDTSMWAPLASAPAMQVGADTARFYGTWVASFSVNGQTVTMVSVHNANGYSNTWRSAQGDTPAGNGGFSAADGKYKTTAPWPNGSGTYRFTDDDTVVCTNAAGQTVTWHRQKATE